MHLFQPEFFIMDFPYFPCYLDYFLELWEQ